MLEVAILLAGWFLGLLSPQIVERIARRYRRPELMRSIALEIDELRFKLITTRCNIRMSTHRLDREFVSWAAARAREYQGVLKDHPSRQDLLQLATYSDERLDQLNAVPQNPKEVISFPKYYLPYLQSQQNQMPILPEEVQRRLLEILARLEMFNATADKLEANLQRTFGPQLSPENWEALQTNNRKWWAAQDTTARQIVEQADALLPVLRGSQSNSGI